MKPKPLLTVLAVTALATFNPQLSTLAQGSLTPPPGAPAPVMKSLAQIEARTPISSVPIIISHPGSYYLTTNLHSAYNSSSFITITANDVTVDLNGFSMAFTNGTSAYPGIFINAATNVVIQNGNFSRLSLFASSSRNITATTIAVRDCSGHGISLGYSETRVESCSVMNVGGHGIVASVVKNSTVRNATYNGINGNSVSDCVVENATESGIWADVVQNCTAYGATIFGINADETAINCNGRSASGVGLKATVVMSSTGYRPGGRAIEATVANSCFAQSGTNLITYKYNMP